MTPHTKRAVLNPKLTAAEKRQLIEIASRGTLKHNQFNPFNTGESMKPLPKWAGIVAAIGAVFGALASADVIAVLPEKVGALIATIAPIIILLSHSLTGTGGKK